MISNSHELDRDIMSGWLTTSVMSLTERHNVLLVISISHELDRDIMPGWLSASVMSLTERHNVWLVINISHELDRDMSGWLSATVLNSP